MARHLTALIDQQRPQALPSTPCCRLSPRAERARKIAERLTADGWRFLECQGPRGIYFEGRGPRGCRLMSEQHPEKGEALLKAIFHASQMS